MKKTHRIFALVIALFLTASLFAQQEVSRQKFSPEQFEAELQQYIIQEAALTPQEVAQFFPLYREMHQKQRALYGRQKHICQVKPADEQGCMKVIQERDNLDIEQHRIQQSYHNKFFDILPASKVYDVLKAEERFHKLKFKQWGRGSSHKEKK